MKNKKNLRKKYQIKKNKSFTEGWIFAFFYFFSFLLAALVILLKFYPFLDISLIEVNSAENLKKESIEEFIEENIESNFLALKTKNILFFSPKELKSKILKKTSIIEDVEIEKTFPAKITVSTKERIPFAIWCAKTDIKSCAFIDRSGVAFQRIDGLRKGLLVFVKEREPSLGVQILTSEELDTLVSLRSAIIKKGIHIKYLQTVEQKDILVHTEEGWVVYLSSNNYEKEVENLSLILKSLDQKKRNNLDYIDLRFGDRIYYK